MYHCRCECGAEVVVRAELLRNGRTRSCGCLRAALAAEADKESGRIFNEGAKGHDTTEYHTWAAMKARCLNERHKQYPEYGGRGIRVCERWLTYRNFLADMGRKPSTELSIDRIDNDGDYEPGNCRWATRTEQNNNRRPNRGRRKKQLTILGNTKNLDAWLADAGLTYFAYWRRTKAGELAEDVILDALLSRA